MSLTPRFVPRSGLAGLSLVLIAAALAGCVALFFVLGRPTEGRGARAAERVAPPAVASEEPGPQAEEARGAPPVELLPAGITAAAVTSGEPAAQPAKAAAAQPLALASDEPAAEAVTEEGKVPGPELKYVREGKSEEVAGKSLHRGRREERRAREAEAAALGLPNEKRKVESPKKNASRSQVKKAENKSEAERRSKGNAPKSQPDKAPAGG